MKVTCYITDLSTSATIVDSDIDSTKVSLVYIDHDNDNVLRTGKVQLGVIATSAVAY